MPQDLMRLRRELSAFIEQRCRYFGLQCECPFVSNTVEFAGYLPQFGGPRGLLIDIVAPRRFISSERHKAVAKALGVSISLVNPSSMLQDSEEFIDLLRDWILTDRLSELPQEVRALLDSSPR